MVGAVIDPSVLEFCQNLPKIELHAHVIGSISDDTLHKILRRRQNDVQLDHHVYGDMADVFSMFKTLHDVIDNVDDVYTVTYDVIHELHQDGVKYLELRSTPRNVPKTGMSKRSHVETMIKAVKDCQYLNCVTRLLLSIDRKESLESAKENVDLAIEFKETGLIVGIDLSGNPNIGDPSEFREEIARARANGLKVSLHISEVPGRDSEAKTLLEMMPDRIGHGSFLSVGSGGAEENEIFVSKNQIPLELCLTSNLKTKTVKSYRNHHFRYWYERGHPVVICTDDKGVFRTTLSHEYAVAMSVFGLTRDVVGQLVLKSIEFIFEEEEIKKKVRSEIKNTLSNLL